MNFNKVYYPGQVITEYNPDIQAGRGTYVKDGQVVAAIVGKLCQDQKVISLVNFHDDEQPELRVGSLVVGRVERIKDHQVRVRVLKVDGKKSQKMEALLRKQNIRQTEIDKIKMDEAFLPGDIILAKLISYSDSQKIYLTTAEESLGVIFAVSKVSGEMMIPVSWEEMVCLKTGQKEKRIVAKPDFSQFKIDNQQN